MSIKSKQSLFLSSIAAVLLCVVVGSPAYQLATSTPAPTSSLRYSATSSPRPTGSATASATPPIVIVIPSPPGDEPPVPPGKIRVKCISPADMTLKCPGAQFCYDAKDRIVYLTGAACTSLGIDNGDYTPGEVLGIADCAALVIKPTPTPKPTLPEAPPWTPAPTASSSNSIVPVKPSATASLAAAVATATPQSLKDYLTSLMDLCCGVHHEIAGHAAQGDITIARPADRARYECSAYGVSQQCLAGAAASFCGKFPASETCSALCSQIYSAQIMATWQCCFKDLVEKDQRQGTKTPITINDCLACHQQCIQARPGNSSTPYPPCCSGDTDGVNFDVAPAIMSCDKFFNGPATPLPEGQVSAVGYCSEYREDKYF